MFTFDGIDPSMSKQITSPSYSCQFMGRSLQSKPPESVRIYNKYFNHDVVCFSYIIMKIVKEETRNCFKWCTINCIVIYNNTY